MLPVLKESTQHHDLDSSSQRIQRAKASERPRAHSGQGLLFVRREWQVLPEDEVVIELGSEMTPSVIATLFMDDPSKNGGVLSLLLQ